MKTPSDHSPPQAAECEAVRAVRALQQTERKRLGTQMKLAKATGLSQTIWSAYLRGEKVPAMRTRKRIARKLGIAPESWESVSIGANNGVSTDKVLTEPPSVTNSAQGDGLTVDLAPEFSQVAP